jgi:nucleotide-binding universal stress UspA family protein
MDFKTILVHVDDTAGASDRAAFAASLANAQQAHLIGATQTGISRFVREAVLPSVELGDLTPLFNELREAAIRRGAQFEATAREASLASFESRIDDDEAALALAIHALYADLVIVGRTARSDSGYAVGSGIPEYVAMNSPAPVLVLPQAATHAPGFERVLVAWNASPEAARAVRLALPFLVRAREVELAIFDEESSSVRSSRDERDMALFLTRHGVKVDVRRHHARGEIGNALLVLAEDSKADLLVMGCYGHSRYREIMLGGASRTVLHRAPLPVLLAH